MRTLIRRKAIARWEPAGIANLVNIYVHTCGFFDTYITRLETWVWSPTQDIWTPRLLFHWQISIGTIVNHILIVVTVCVIGLFIRPPHPTHPSIQRQTLSREMDILRPNLLIWCSFSHMLSGPDKLVRNFIIKVVFCWQIDKFFSHETFFVVDRYCCIITWRARSSCWCMNPAWTLHYENCKCVYRASNNAYNYHDTFAVPVPRRPLLNFPVWRWCDSQT